MIRLATLEDTPAIGQLWSQMIDYHLSLDPEMPHAAPDGAERYQRRVEGRLNDSMTRVLVAEIDGEVVAYVLGMVVDLIPEIFEQMHGGFVADIFVSLDHRRKGIGRELVERLVLWFQSKGITYFEWHVANSNTDGVAFWESVGGKSVMLRMRANIEEDQS